MQDNDKSGAPDINSGAPTQAPPAETAPLPSGQSSSHAPPTSAQPRPSVRQTDAKLLELLVCPLTKRSLRYDSARQELISVAARLAFPIRDGVPLMTVEAARQLGDHEA